ncbi:hypothetical protein NC651_036914 [Populus alba x Populus x berolinensis]|nr:hypothetical protein NC651_036914 [Populus alba x Populus x berolinensis]
MFSCCVFSSLEPKRVSKSASWKAQAQAPYQSLSQLHKKSQARHKYICFRVKDFGFDVDFFFKIGASWSLPSLSLLNSV